MRLTRRGLLAAAPLGAAVWSVAGCDSGKQGDVAPRPWTGATALTGHEDTPHALATDGTDVYFATGGSQVGENAIRVVPLAGGTSRVLSRPLPDFVPRDEMAVADGQVYVASGSDIYRVTVADGTTQVVVPQRPGSILHLAAGGGFIWWSTGQLNSPLATEVARMPLAGGEVEVLAVNSDVPGMTSASAFALQGDGALVACSEGILRVAPGVRPVVVVPTDTPATQILVAGDTVYFLVVGRRTSVRSVPVAGGSATDLGADLDDNGSIAVVGDQVVGVRTAGQDGKVLAVPVTGGDARTLATGPYVGTALTATGTTIVFVGGDQVWSTTL